MSEVLERFTWVWQSTYLWRGDDVIVYIDPTRVSGDPPADVIFVTHAHWDHYDSEDIEKVRKPDTTIVAPHDVAQELSGDVRPVAPGDSLEVAGIRVMAVPAYNVVEERLDKHPKENDWVGYVLTLGEATYYHAGDTDHVPELDQLRSDVAFLPVGGTFTMTAGEAAGLARSISPRLAVPMHYGFAAGTPADAETFRREADPVTVELLTPQLPFERE